jgi:hypothetical protein
VAHKRKNPVGDGKSGGAGRNFLAGKQGSSSQKAPAGQAAANRRNRPDNDAIWDACRRARDATASREAQAVANLQSAALKFGGFTLREKGDRWVTYCPHCGGKVELYSTNSGVGVVGYSPKCDAISRIEQWLCENGFQT